MQIKHFAGANVFLSKH